jgi:hypothetical protein
VYYLAMNEEEKKIQDIEEHGHEATGEELDALEGGTPLETPVETELPEDMDDVEENMFPSAD